MAIPTHVVCPKCGSYKGRTVVEVPEAGSKKKKRDE
jgi:hypothetical protein